MVVLDVNDDRDLVRVLPLELQDQAQAVVEAHRVLVIPVAFELLEVKGRRERIEIALVGSAPDELHSLSKTGDHTRGIPGAVYRIGFEAIQALIRVPHLHGQSVRDSQRGVNTRFYVYRKLVK